jgi:tRNA-uridine 2-sulfurtransferase
MPNTPLKTRSKKPRVALGVSGGVDSSTCAHLLVEQGYEVTAVYLECWRAPGCRTEEDRKDALKIALALDIPFQVLDFKQQYHDRVVEHFFAEYAAGRTPNPDVACNKEIKFGLFYDWAMAEGFEYVSTGHYAKIGNVNDATVLLTPKDEHKDQTYFLHVLTENHLQHTLFPLAEMTKAEVRQEAARRNLHNADKKDSVGICFIGDIDTGKFLKERLGENPGEVVDAAGHVIGRHRGLWFYTIGQRHGFEIQAKSLVKQADGSTVSKHNIPPFYVIDKDPERNQLVVGFGGQTFRQQFSVSNPHWINHSYRDFMDKSTQVYVRIRHPGQLLPCTIQTSGSSLEVSLVEPAQGVAEGQAAVFYIPDPSDSTAHVCLGGGVIAS